jgi:CubicO group peptidase (beta-lactamase class C family)
MKKPLAAVAVAATLLAISVPSVWAAPSVRPQAPDSPSPGVWTATAITDANVNAAVAALPGLIAEVQRRTGVPGMAAAVVYQDRVLLSAGYGVREAGTNAPVDADTRFQMASVSKPVAATVISREVSKGTVAWDDPIRGQLASFALKDPYVTKNVTIGDMFSHRSGLPEHAGDDLEDIGYGRAQVLSRLRYLPLHPFRAVYDYTNFGLTAGAEAVARAARTSWENLARTELFAPAAMNSSSYRFSDYWNAANKALTHVKIDGVWQHGETRNAQAQSPAGGLSSTANDMARWLRLQLGDGTIDGQQLIKPEVLQLMRQPHMDSSPSKDPAGRSGGYGYGIGSGVDGTGHVKWSHSGAFALGAGTTVDMIPDADLGIVVMSNGQANGEAESVAESFLDIAETGTVQRDWLPLLAKFAFAPLYENPSVLAGKPVPAGAKPSLPLDRYTGVYGNDYFGPATIVQRGGHLTMLLGPKKMAFPLTSWGGNDFSWVPTGENAVGITKVTFNPKAGTLLAEFLDKNGLGTFTK